MADNYSAENEDQMHHDHYRKNTDRDRNQHNRRRSVSQQSFEDRDVRPNPSCHMKIERRKEERGTERSDSYLKLAEEYRTVNLPLDIFIQREESDCHSSGENLPFSLGSKSRCGSVQLEGNMLREVKFRNPEKAQCGDVSCSRGTSTSLNEKPESSYLHAMCIPEKNFNEEPTFNKSLAVFNVEDDLDFSPSMEGKILSQEIKVLKAENNRLKNTLHEVHGWHSAFDSNIGIFSKKNNSDARLLPAIKDLVLFLINGNCSAEKIKKIHLSLKRKIGNAEDFHSNAERRQLHEQQQLRRHQNEQAIKDKPQLGLEWQHEREQAKPLERGRKMQQQQLENVIIKREEDWPSTSTALFANYPPPFQSLVHTEREFRTREEERKRREAWQRHENELQQLRRRRKEEKLRERLRLEREKCREYERSNVLERMRKRMLQQEEVNVASDFFAPGPSSTRNGSEERRSVGHEKRREAGESFFIDASAASESEVKSEIPKYESNFIGVLHNDKQQESDSTLQEKKNVLKHRVLKKFETSCFNCSGNHHMRNCPIEINHRRVAFAKSQYKSSKPPTHMPVRSVRYHAQTENEEKKYNCKPGVISAKLREALNLHENQIPLHIYRMRILGYPPGWLQEAAVEKSGIVVYGSDGNADEESTKTDKKDDPTLVCYDPEKLIDFPGFNAPLPENCIDESERLGFPPLQECQSRSYMEKEIPKINIKPKRKRPLDCELTNSSISKERRLDEDMEIEEISDENTIESLETFSPEFIPPLPDSIIASPPPLPDEDYPFETSAEQQLSPKIPIVSEVVRNNEDDIPHSGTVSPTLDDLEEIKRQLESELGLTSSEIPNDRDGREIQCEDEDSSSKQESLEDVNEFDEEELFLELKSDEEQENSNLCPETLSTVEPGTSDCVEKSHSTVNRSKFLYFGTPSLSLHSPFSKLPEYDKFAKDISPHLNFENLPNSTGAYKKMRNVLTKVREKLANLE